MITPNYPLLMIVLLPASEPRNVQLLREFGLCYILFRELRCKIEGYSDNTIGIKIQDMTDNIKVQLLN
jgi:hypothetical protein